jgi:hypothetical protein
MNKALVLQKALTAAGCRAVVDGKDVEVTLWVRKGRSKMGQTVSQYALISWDAKHHRYYWREDWNYSQLRQAQDVVTVVKEMLYAIHATPESVFAS